MSIIFIDIETTGTDIDKSEVIEIAALKCDEAHIFPFARIQMMVFPENGINADAQKINGITWEMVRYAYHLPEALDNLFAFIKSTDKICGHNFKKFDSKFLERHGHEFKGEIIDTLDIAAEVGFKQGQRSLKYLTNHFNLSIPPHRAAGDVDATRRVYIELMKMKQNRLFEE